jgi:hypothetical protein
MEYPNYFEQVALANFEKYLPLIGDGDLKLLQIGVFRGDASIYLAENFLVNPNSKLYDVDLWGGTSDPSHAAMDFHEIEKDYEIRLKKHISKGKVIKHKMSSQEFFLLNKVDFDFIYIDGDHSMLSVLSDGINAFQALKIGGILAFDDYGGALGYPINKRPGPAIDSLLVAWTGNFEVLEKGYQVWLQKK